MHLILIRENTISFKVARKLQFYNAEDKKCKVVTPKTLSTIGNTSLYIAHYFLFSVPNPIISLLPEYRK